MMDQFFDNSVRPPNPRCRSSRSFFKQWTQPWSSGGPFAGGDRLRGATSGATSSVAGSSSAWIDLLNKHRQSLDSTYAAGIQIIEQTVRASDAKSPDDYRQLMEDLWRKLFETFKTQSEAQFSAFQQWSQKSAEAAQDVRV